MVRRSPQKKKGKTGTPAPAPSAAARGDTGTAPTGTAPQAGVNWWSVDTAPSLAPSSEPWTPSGHGSERAGARSPLRSPTKPLEQQVSSLQAQREAADADLWNARVELQDHAQQREVANERIAKLTTELARLRSEYDHDSQALDELRSHEEELKTQLEHERTRATRDRQSVREQIEDRDRFIDSLQTQLDELREQLKSAPYAAARTPGDANEAPGDVSSGTGDITSLTIDLDNDTSGGVLPAAAEVPQTAGMNELLSQTHQAKQQRALRSALQKQRLENFQLRKQLAELKGAPAPQWPGEEHHQEEDDSSSHAVDDSLLHLKTNTGGDRTPDASIAGLSPDMAVPEVPSVPLGVPLSEDFVDEAQLEHDAQLLGLAVVPQEELDVLRRSHSDAANLESLTSELRKKYDAHIVPSDELEALKNPGMELLHDQAYAINHRLVPIHEYEELQNTQAVRAKLKLTDDELKLAHELLRGRRRSKSKIHSHVLQDLARVQALGLSPDVSYRYSESSRDASVSPSRTGSRHQRSLSHSSSISDAESGYTDNGEVGVGTALRQIAHNHGFELVSDTVAGSRDLAQRHGLATVPLTSVSTIADSHIVPAASSAAELTSNNVVLSLSPADVERIQKLLEVSPVDLSELQRRAYTPTSADITEQAAAMGLAVLPLEDVAEMKGQLRQRSVPDASFVADLAQKAGLRVIPEHPTLDELRDFAPEDAVLVERETWDALDNPEPATLRRLAKQHGLAVLPEKEVELLQRRPPATAEPDKSQSSLPSLSVDELREAAQKHDLVVLSADDYRSILSSHQVRDFSHLPMAARTEHFEKLIKSSKEARISATSPRESPSASSLGSLSDRITRLGFVPVEQEEYKRLLASQRVYEPTKSDILRSAKQFGLATMPLEEYTRLRSSHWSSPSKSRDSSFVALGSPKSSPSKGDYVEEEDNEGFTAVPSEYLAALRRIVEHPNRSDVDALARKVGLTVSGESSDAFSGTKEQLSTAEIIAAAQTIGLVEPLSNDEIILRGKSLGLIEPHDVPEPLTEKQIMDQAKSLGLVDPLSEADIVSKAKLSGLVEPLTENELLEAAKAKGLVDPLPDSDILANAKSLGLIEPLTEAEIIEAAKSKGLVDPLSDSDIITKAKSLGLAEPLSEQEVVEAAKVKGLVDPLSDPEILEKAKSLGLIEPLTDSGIIESARSKGLVDPLSDPGILEKAKSLGLIEPLTDSEIIQAARSKGLVDPLSDPEILEKAKSLGLIEPLTDSEIIQAARSKGLVDPLSDPEILEKAKSLGLIEPLTDSEIIQAARSKGLVDPLSETEILEKAKSLGLIEPLTDSEIIQAARSKGLVDPLSETEILEKAKSLGLIEPLTDSETIESARSKGLVDPLSDPEILEKAKSLGLVEAPTEAQIIEAARSKGLVDPPSESEIVTKAKTLGLVEPMAEAEIIEAARARGLVTPLSVSELLARARSFGLSEPLTETQIIEEAKAKGLVEPLSESDIVAKAKSLGLVQPPTESEIIDAARSKGFVDSADNTQVLDLVRSRSSDKALQEFIIQIGKELGLSEPISDEEVLQKARQLGLVEKLSDGDILAHAEKLGYAKRLSDSEIRERANALGLVDPPSDSEICDKAKTLGLAVPLTEDEIIDIAKSFGLVERLSDDQVVEQAQSLGLVQPLSDDEVTEKAMSLGLAKPLSEPEIIEKATSLGLQRPLSDEEVLDKAKSLGLITPPTDAEVLEKAEGLGLVKPLSDEEILERAKPLGLPQLAREHLLEEAKKLGLREGPTESEILESAKSLGLVEPMPESHVLEKARALGFTEPFSEQQIIARAQELGMVYPLSHTQLLESAKSKGLVDPYTDSQIRESALKLGMIDPSSNDEVISAAKRLGLVEPLSEQQIQEVVKERGFVKPLTETELIVAAKERGLVEPLIKAEALPSEKSLGIVDSAEATRNSQQLSETEIKSTHIRNEDSNLGDTSELSTSLDNDNASAPAHMRQLSSTAKSEASTNGRPYHGRQSSTAETPTEAAMASIAPRSSGHGRGGSFSRKAASPPARKPVASSAANVKAPVPPPVPDRIRSDMSRSSTVDGFGGIPLLAPRSTTAPYSETGFSDGSRGDPSVAYGPDGPGQVTNLGLPQRLGRSPVRQANRRAEADLLAHDTASNDGEQPSPVKGIPRSATSGSLRGYRHNRGAHGSQSSNGGSDTYNLPLPRSSSFQHHHHHQQQQHHHHHMPFSRYQQSIAESTGSSWAVETVTGATAEQYINQIVLGEVLYKYTSSGFNFEGLTGGRHKRFFWFRPDSMVLYWHRENPHFLASLYGPAKSITVVGVEDISDRNPLPAGLFHRSLLIRGKERDIRVTCATSSRHQVWVSSLRNILKERSGKAA